MDRGKDQARGISVQIFRKIMIGVFVMLLAAWGWAWYGLVTGNTDENPVMGVIGVGVCIVVYAAMVWTGRRLWK